MSMSSVAGMTIALALLAVLVIGLLSYMSALVRKAYELKVEVNALIDHRLKEVEEHMLGRGRQMRRDLQEELGKVRDTMAREAEAHRQDITAATAGQVSALRSDTEAMRVALLQALEDTTRRQQELQRALESLQRDVARLHAPQRSALTPSAPQTAPTASQPQRPPPHPLPPEMEDDSPPLDLRAIPST